MKTFQSFVVALFAVLLIASCENSTSPNTEVEFEPYQVETWFVSSPTKADWEGVNSKRKTPSTQAEGDTVSITSPDGESISMRKVNNIHQVMFTYIDSAGTEYPDSTYYEVSLSDSSLITEYNTHLGIEDFEGFPFKIEFPMYIDCAHIPDTIPESKFFVTLFSIVRPDGVKTEIDTHYVKEIDIKGFVPVVETMRCSD